MEAIGDIAIRIVARLSTTPARNVCEFDNVIILFPLARVSGAAQRAGKTPRLPALNNWSE